MGMYFPYGSPTSTIMRIMREAVFRGKKIDIPYSETHASQQEIAEMRQRIDGSTPEFAQDLNTLVFGEDKVRAILLIKGNFVDSNGEVKNVIVPIDLGTNPWPLYTGREGYNTVDIKITAGSAKEYLMQHKEALRQRGIESFLVEESSFHYARDEDLKGNFVGSKGIEAVDLASLVPYLVDTYGFVGLDEVSKPQEKEFRERAVPFVSYRQKESLLEKLIRKLCQRSPLMHEGDVIADWGAHRICLKEEEALYFGGIFQGRVRVGRFVTRGLYTDNYYQQPKKSGFKAFNITARVSSAKHGDIIRELQIYDLLQHFNAQINEKSPAFHRRFSARARKNPRWLSGAKPAVNCA